MTDPNMYGLEVEATVPKAEDIPIPIPRICVGNTSLQYMRKTANSNDEQNRKINTNTNYNIFNTVQESDRGVLSSHRLRTMNINANDVNPQNAYDMYPNFCLGIFYIKA
jgi:hypothetical protein